VAQNPEYHLQCAVARYLDGLEALGLLVWNHPPLGGIRTPRDGKAMKNQGAKAGEPDCQIWPPVASGVAPFFIEIKHGKTALSPNQRARHALYEAAGYRVHLVRADFPHEATRAVEAILRGCGLV
jgi:hypothetical protein